MLLSDAVQVPSVISFLVRWCWQMPFLELCCSNQLSGWRWYAHSKYHDNTLSDVPQYACLRESKKVSLYFYCITLNFRAEGIRGWFHHKQADSLRIYPKTPAVACKIRAHSWGSASSPTPGSPQSLSDRIPV
jgi:hypothetical protein